ncbi:hypothetical protein [Pseudomonas sp. NPDC088444]|uniref:hypothetical protein n=1 Tax=Pseudomonas sp. NPDC088444 TaxID=3364456 RepID=UPI00384F55DB
MTVAELLTHARIQIAWSGFIQVYSIEGIGLSLPADHDNFEHLAEEFDEKFVFSELWIYP